MLQADCRDGLMFHIPELTEVRLSNSVFDPPSDSINPLPSFPPARLKAALAAERVVDLSEFVAPAAGAGAWVHA